MLSLSDERQPGYGCEAKLPQAWNLGSQPSSSGRSRSTKVEKFEVESHDN